MAISKQQPMREAEIDLVEQFNAYLENTNATIQQYEQDLQIEIRAREALELRVAALEQ